MPFPWENPSLDPHIFLPSKLLKALIFHYSTSYCLAFLISSAIFFFSTAACMLLPKHCTSSLSSSSAQTIVILIAHLAVQIGAGLKALYKWFLSFHWFLSVLPSLDQLERYSSFLNIENNYCYVETTIHKPEMLLIETDGYFSQEEKRK